MLGVDPYDELTDNYVQLLTSRVGKLKGRLRFDLLEAATANSLSCDLDWLDHALPLVVYEAAPRSGNLTTQSQPLTAHRLGYERARLFRRHFDLSLEPITDLSALLHGRCGWPPEDQHAVSIQGTSNLSALVGRDDGGNPRVIRPPLGHWARRFRLARSLFFLPDPQQQTHPRLVTRAYTWDQKASRAFAAELLAPAEALRTEVTDTVSFDDMDQLARQFQVSPTLIQHQLINHRIAWVDPL